MCVAKFALDPKETLKVESFFKKKLIFLGHTVSSRLKNKRSPD